MKRVALIAAAIVLAACGGAAETPATEEAPAASAPVEAPAMTDSATMTPDSATMTPDSAAKPDSAAM
ncbi:MAG: hypothetical protein MUD17_10190 [Gemmatimonadaceae bacterium]|jgi:hypothetical protein|nr:hypothetical protein [Gemmatimonadaceae bacterium]